MTAPAPKTGPSGGAEDNGLLDHHRQFLDMRAVSGQVAQARGYSSTMLPGWLRNVGFPLAASKQVPGLVIPVYDVHGDLAFYQYRPDTPRFVDGKPAKYERPKRMRGVIDVPRSVRDKLDDPTIPLWITESPIKADALVSAGLVAVGLFGVWGWRVTNHKGGKVLSECFEFIALNGRTVFLAPDSDLATNNKVEMAVGRLGRALAGRQANVRYLTIPGGRHGQKVGIDDFLAAGGIWEDLVRLADEEPPGPPPAPAASVDLYFDKHGLKVARWPRRCGPRLSWRSARKAPSPYTRTAYTMSAGTR